MTIYLDASASAPLLPAAREAMLRVWEEGQANSSSVHSAGAQAAREVANARECIASAFGLHPAGVVFTSGGTEANNLGIIGQVLALSSPQRVLTTRIEHSSVLASCDYLHRFHGVRVDYIPVDGTGRLTWDDAMLEGSTAEETLVAIGLANAEVGTVNDVSPLIAATQRTGIALHVDAVQAAAQLPLSMRAGAWPGEGISSVAIASHKFGGPQGVGALLLPKPVAVEPTMRGGSQEDGRRAGTLNVAGIAGFAAAVAEHAAQCGTKAVALMKSRDELISAMLANVPGARLTGHPTERLPGHASFVFEGVSGESVLVALDMAGYAVSSGSACRAGDAKPSPVLSALGISADVATTAVRFSLPAPLTPEHIARIVDLVRAEVTKR